jgi:hypothetical protein
VVFHGGQRQPMLSSGPDVPVYVATGIHGVGGLRSIGPTGADLS